MKVEAGKEIQGLSLETFKASDTHALLSASAELILHLKSFLNITSSLGVNPNNISASDPLHMGDYWEAVKTYPPQEVLQLIEMRREEIRSLKEKLSQNYSSIDRAEEKLIPAPEGEGSAYFLFDIQGAASYVVKPLDEEIFCINNPKGHSTPFVSEEYRLRPYIPPYTSAFNEVLSYETARIAGIENSVPHTHLEILTHPSFNDISDKIDPKLEPWNILKKDVDREKICSVQEFVPDAISLSSLVKKWLSEGATDEEILNSIDMASYEDALILTWLTFDNDAHSANFLAYPLLHSENKPLFGLKKIDNSLTFPEHNRDMFNFLLALPHAKMPLSERAKKIIAEISIQEISDALCSLQRKDAAPAFLKRIEELKTQSQSSATIEEIHQSFKRSLYSLRSKEPATKSSWIAQRQKMDDLLVSGLRKISIKDSYCLKINRGI